MQITQEQVIRTAAMAKLSLRNDEVSSLRQQIQEMLDHVAKATPPGEKGPGAVPAKANGRLAYFTEPWQGLRQEEVLALAPDSQQGFIRVPRVMSDD